MKKRIKRLIQIMDIFFIGRIMLSSETKINTSQHAALLPTRVYCWRSLIPIDWIHFRAPLAKHDFLSDY
jgi:hypothetical protein